MALFSCEKPRFLNSSTTGSGVSGVRPGNELGAYFLWSNSWQ
jgi:hypothetical protein